MRRARSKLLLATITVACLVMHAKAQATPDLLEKLKGMSFKCPISANGRLGSAQTSSTGGISKTLFF